jgi:hypothetical protein
MLARYQNGCLQRIVRKDGVERWQFRWLKKGADGISHERKKTIGPVKDYPENSKKLQDLLAGLRLNINTDGPTELTSITMTEVVGHYKLHELADRGGDDKAYSTRNRKSLVLNRWVLPGWGSSNSEPSKPLQLSSGWRRSPQASLVNPNLLRAAQKKRFETR